MSSTFGALPLPPELLAVLAELGHTTPTPIQTMSIPPLVAGRDVMGQSKTGSGKTVAFALPILARIELGSRSVQALVVCPTRELAQQVAREVRTLGRKHDGLVVATLTGGEPFARQSAALERGVHVAIGTPGRLLDHLRRETLDTTGVQVVVLDEADRMLDMGFQNDVETILRALPKERQTALFSATFPPTIQKMSAIHQKDPLPLMIDEGEQPKEIEHRFLLSDHDKKIDALLAILSEQKFESALVFCNFKASVKDVVAALRDRDASVDSLHGDLEQFERDQVWARFRNLSLRILVATDVAGRGLDLDGLDLVVNFEMPQQADTYVHRVGRTGRAGKSGRAVSLYTRREEEKVADVEALLGGAIERRPAPEFTRAMRANAHSGFARPALMDSILISGGRKDKVRKGDILGALTGEAGGLEGTQVGKIEIHDRLSYVAVSAEVSRKAVASLNSGRIKRKRFRCTLVRSRS